MKQLNLNNYGTDPTFVQQLFIQQMKNLTMKSMDSFDYQFSDSWTRPTDEPRKVIA